MPGGQQRCPVLFLVMILVFSRAYLAVFWGAEGCVEVKGFPTIIFFPAGKDAKPITFDGNDCSPKVRCVAVGGSLWVVPGCHAGHRHEQALSNIFQVGSCQCTTSSSSSGSNVLRQQHTCLHEA
jgi:hypothetical protein